MIIFERKNVIGIILVTRVQVIIRNFAKEEQIRRSYVLVDRSIIKVVEHRMGDRSKSRKGMPTPPGYVLGPDLE